MKSDMVQYLLQQYIIHWSLWTVLTICTASGTDIFRIYFGEQAGVNFQELQYPADDDTLSRKVYLMQGSNYISKCSCYSIDVFYPVMPIWQAVVNSNNNNSMPIQELDSTNNNDISTQYNTSQVFWRRNSRHSYADLLLYNVGESIAGSYMCVTSCGNRSIEVIVRNLSVTIFTKRFDKVAFTSADGFSMIPLLGGDPQPLLENVTWYFNNKQVVDYPKEMGIKILNLSDKIFLFNFIYGYRREHTGEYTAMLNTLDGTTANDSFYLQVHTFPEITLATNCTRCLKDGNTIVTVLGENLTISCMTYTTDPPPQFIWFKNGPEDPSKALVSMKHLSIIERELESQLMLDSIASSDSGEYSCKANNTFMKDIKGITVKIEYLPYLSAITSRSINIPVGTDLQLLVKVVGGYPTPTVNWFNETSQTCLAEGGRIEFSGELNANISIKNVTASDSGSYVIIVDNGLEKTKLQFNITILVPPTLSKLSNSSVYSLVGGMASFKVAISDASFKLSRSDIQWTGNFEEQQQEVVLKDSVTSLILNNLEVSNSGDVLLTIDNVTQHFHLTVFNPPNIPNPVSIVECSGFVEINWKSTTPPLTTALVDEVFLEQQTCSFVDVSCHEKWTLLGHFRPSGQLLISLSPNFYSFRLTSCNRLFGCGQPLIISTEVKSRAQESMMSTIKNLSSLPLNSSSFGLMWTEESYISECYEVFYEISCHEVITNNLSPNDSLPVQRYITSADMSRHYSIILSHLKADSEYNCSVVLLYHNSFDTSINSDLVRLASITGYTLPKPLSTTIAELNVFTITNKGLSVLGTLLLDGNISTIKRLSDTIGFIRVFVLRLGRDPILPEGTPDKLYKVSSDFGTYISVHSRVDADGAVFRPYIAAEFDFEDIPDEFIIGGGALDKYNNTNGPLYLSDYYTVFVRFYAKSRLDRQYSVFISSVFSNPSIKPWIDERQLIHAGAVAIDGEDRHTPHTALILSIIVPVAVVLVFIVMVAIIARKTSFMGRFRKIKSASYPELQDTTSEMI